MLYYRSTDVYSILKMMGPGLTAKAIART